MFGQVYCITNLINGRFYIGQTIRSLSYRWSVHKSDSKYRPESWLHKAIRKYGPENFDIQRLGVAATEDDLNRLEEMWILATGACKREFGYNLKTGGSQGRPTPEVIEKIRAKNTGRKLSEEHRRRMSAARKGVKHSPEHTAKIAAALKGRTPSPQCRASVALANSRRQHSDETRRKLSLSTTAKNYRYHAARREKLSGI